MGEVEETRFLNLIIDSKFMECNPPLLRRNRKMSWSKYVSGTANDVTIAVNNDSTIPANVKDGIVAVLGRFAGMHVVLATDGHVGSIDEIYQNCNIVIRRVERC